MGFTDETVRFNLDDSNKKEISETLTTVYRSLDEKGYNPISVVPDLGFPYEADAVRTIIPSAEVAVVHIKREGYTFDGDSRNYVPKAKYRIEKIDIIKITI